MVQPAGSASPIGGPPTPGIGFGAGIERLLLAVENEGTTWDSPHVAVFVVVDGGSRQTAQTVLQQLRRAGVAADMDYAGRSTKGQLSQASRSGAPTVVILREGDAVVRAAGRQDVTVAVGEVVATLTGP